LVVPTSSDWCARRECSRSNVLQEPAPCKVNSGSGEIGASQHTAGEALRNAHYDTSHLFFATSGSAHVDGQPLLHSSRMRSGLHDRAIATRSECRRRFAGRARYSDTAMIVHTPVDCGSLHNARSPITQSAVKPPRGRLLNARLMMTSSGALPSAESSAAIVRVRG